MHAAPAAPHHLWAVVLAGGEGMRMRSLARRVCGDERPKQYVALFGERTLLRQTLDRVALEIPASRTIVVTLRSHAGYFAERAGSGEPRVLVQPVDRGTAAGILFPIRWLYAQDPDAKVAVFPSDHFVLEETAFMAHVVRTAIWVDEHPDRLVLLGARAIEAEVEYGWIETGRPLDSMDGLRMWAVRRFWEKPSEERARLCLENGCLWNTLVMIGKAATFVRAGREALPDVDDRLSRIAPFVGTEEEAWAIHQAYALLPKANFSRAILEPCPPFLAVSELPPITWSDLGSPPRVFDALRRLDTRPSWVEPADLAVS